VPAGEVVEFLKSLQVLPDKTPLLIVREKEPDEKQKGMEP